MYIKNLLGFTKYMKTPNIFTVNPSQLIISTSSEDMEITKRKINKMVNLSLQLLRLVVVPNKEDFR